MSDAILEAISNFLRQNSANTLARHQAIDKDVGEIAAPIAQAFMAPGNALRGEYSNVEISPNGAVTPFDPRLMSEASNMAGVVSLGSMPIPRPFGSLGMGASMYHGSPDIRWMDQGLKFSGENPVTAPSQYMFASPKKNVAESYAGISDMARWKAENGMGPQPSEYAGIRKVELQDGANILKIRDVNKLPDDLGVKWGGVDSLERLLNAARDKGYDAVQMIPDGGNYAILNPNAIKKVSTPK